MRNQRKLLIEQLDRKLKPFSGSELVIVPKNGWINTIRTTLNITLEQIGKKLNMTKQGAKRIEESEAAGTITINSLKEVGNALEMKFVYGFIPYDGSIDSLLDRKSRILAEKIILRLRVKARVNVVPSTCRSATLCDASLLSTVTLPSRTPLRFA